MELKKVFAIAFAVLGIAGCSQNLMRDFSDANSDDALIYNAKSEVNAQNYQVAIDILTNQLSAAGKTKVSARETLASAYAGKCGLNFINYMDSISTATTGSAMYLAAHPFVGVAVDSASCLLALQTLDLIGSTATRTTDQNAFAAVIGMVLMGSAVRLYTDNSPVNGDDAPDAPNIACTLTAQQVDEIILGYGYMSTNISYLGAQLGSSTNTFNNSISTCQAVAGSSCSITDPAQITQPLRDTMMDLLNTSQYGVGTVDGSIPANIPGACP